MIWALIAVSLRFSFEGELQHAETVNQFESESQCLRMAQYVREESKKLNAQAKIVVLCVALEKPEKS